MDRVTAIFVEGLGAAAANSGILSQLQGRIFALLYVQEEPLSLEAIATELQQSKSNISVTIRGLVEWHLVRRTSVAGSRKDHYEAATNFWRVLQEVLERRFRWNLRQALAAAAEAERALEQGGRGSDAPSRESAAFITGRLMGLKLFFTAVDAAIGAFTQGKSIDGEALRNVVSLVTPVHKRR